MTAGYEPGQLIQGRFEIRGRGAPGRLGPVYRAHDREMEVDVALKVLDRALLPDGNALEQFIARMQRVKGLAHPNLARFYDARIERGCALLVMQYTPGVTLETLVGMRTSASAGNDPGYRWAEARPVLAQTAAGLGHALSQKVVHGDLRPSAVVVLPEGVKITAVGLGAALPRAPFLKAVEAGGGELRLAPEVRAGASCDERADVYGFAVLAVEMLTAALPHPGLTVFDPRGPFELALERALDPHPEKRFPTVEALLAELDRSVPGAARSTRPSDPALRAFQPRILDPPALRETTQRIDEDELRKMAGEISQLIETTRRMDPEEVEGLRIESHRFPLIEEEAELELEGQGGKRSPLRTTPEVTVPGRSPRATPSVVTALAHETITWPGGPLPARGREPPHPGGDAAPDGAPTAPVVLLSEDDARTGLVQKVAAAARPADLPDDDPETFRVLLDVPPDLAARAREATGAYYEAVKLSHEEAEEETPLPPPMPGSDPPAPPASLPLRRAVLTPPPVPDAALSRPRDRRVLRAVAPAPPRAGARKESIEPVNDWPTPPPMEVIPVAVPPPAPVEPVKAWPEAPREQRIITAAAVRATPRRFPLGAVLALLCAFALALGLLAGGIYVVTRLRATPPEPAVPPPILAAAPEPSLPAPPPVAPPSPAPVLEAPKPPPAPPPAALAPPPVAPPASPARPAAAPAGGPCPDGADPVAGGRTLCVDRYEFPGVGQQPRTGISRDQAAAACAARGARLCTDKEWERACRGAGGASYPYGPSYNPTKCNTHGGDVALAGSFPACRSGSGALDMSGNVAEWTVDGVKGGAVGEGDPAGRCSHKERSSGAAAPRIGFRCCSDGR